MIEPSYSFYVSSLPAPKGHGTTKPITNRGTASGVFCLVVTDLLDSYPRDAPYRGLPPHVSRELNSEMIRFGRVCMFCFYVVLFFLQIVYV
jgi:hypothetical protein